MGFKRYEGRIGSANKNAVRIDAKGRLYIRNYFGIKGSYELLWDSEENRIGIHMQKGGSRKLSPTNGGVIASIKGMLDELSIPYPQICFAKMEGEILAITLKETPHE